MIDYKTVNYPSQVIIKTTCDLCGESTENENNWADGYDVDIVSISWKHGEKFPVGESVKTTSIDLCPECFNEKLLTWFKDQGGVPNIKQTNY